MSNGLFEIKVLIAEHITVTVIDAKEDVRLDWQSPTTETMRGLAPLDMPVW